MADILLTGIGELVTNSGPPLHNVSIAIDGGTISFVGVASEAPRVGQGVHIDCGGAAVMPGFVDSHTHLVFAGDRSDEFARRLAGESYSDISRGGGGILSTVADTRSTDEEQLFRLAAARVWRMIRGGTTTVEIKSGYGLDPATEMKLLRVARRIGDELPVTVKTTFLGAHSIPPEFEQDRRGYIDLLIETMLPMAADHADYCDVFVEEGVFTVAEAREILSRAAEFGLPARIHADQLSHNGGAHLAAQIGAASADHLDHVEEADAHLMADAGVNAVLAPGASYSLRGKQAPGAMLLEAGCNVAVATDCNPGTSYFEAMGPIVSLAVVEMGLTVDQAVHAATRGGAISLGLLDRGVIEPGARADILVLDAPSVSHLPYRPATNLVARVISGGKIAV